MSLQKISAKFTDRDRAMSISGALQDLIEPAPDALTVFESSRGEWTLEAYFTEPRDAEALAAEISDLTGLGGIGFEAGSVPDLNWVALSQAALPPVRAGRFTVHGSHDRAKVPRGPNSILIDAGEAFGTAHHATTYGCLAAIDRLVRKASPLNVLDLGCGSCVLAIALAKSLPFARIVATDMDPQSVSVAAGNARQNGAANRIQTLCAAGLHHPSLRTAPPFDLIVANILAAPLIMLAPDLRPALKRGGSLVLSGLLTPQAPEVLAAYRAQGFRLARHDRIAGWSTLTMLRA